MWFNSSSSSSAHTRGYHALICVSAYVHIKWPDLVSISERLVTYLAWKAFGSVLTSTILHSQASNLNIVIDSCFRHLKRRGVESSSLKPGGAVYQGLSKSSSISCLPNFYWEMFYKILPRFPSLLPVYIIFLILPPHHISSSTFVLNCGAFSTSPVFWYYKICFAIILSAIIVIWRACDFSYIKVKMNFAKYWQICLMEVLQHFCVKKTTILHGTRTKTREVDQLARKPIK